MQDKLTKRETQVIDLIEQGLTNRLIAKELQIAKSTVKSLIKNIIAKSGGVSPRIAARQQLMTDKIKDVHDALRELALSHPLSNSTQKRIYEVMSDFVGNVMLKR